MSGQDALKAREEARELLNRPSFWGAVVAAMGLRRQRAMGIGDHDEAARDLELARRFADAAPALFALTRASGWQDELVEAMRDIAEMTDADDPDSYRADDREGCLDAVYSTAIAALAKVPTPPQADGGETK